MLQRANYFPYSYKRYTVAIGIVASSGRLVQIYVQPINTRFAPIERAFYSYVAPWWEFNGHNNIVADIDLNRLQREGPSAEYVIELFDRWYQKLGGKTLYPLGWQYQARIFPVLKSFGLSNYFEQPVRARCPIALAQSLNDLAGQRGDRIPYPRLGKKVVLDACRVEEVGPQAPCTAMSAAECYHKLLRGH